jgi:hypothetical protein
MTEREPEMLGTEFLFRVGMALGRAMAPQPPQIPSLEPGQRVIQMWSAPDAFGYRHLLTFELRESA